MADIAESGCLILWGYNPSFSRITHATATVAGLKRGMKLIVIDPRNVGLANKADVWLRVRPGTDGALALGLANIMIERGWYDQEFVRAWSNGPLLVRSDTDRLLKTEDLVSGSGSGQFVAWDSQSNCAVSYDPVGRALRDTQRASCPARRIHSRNCRRCNQLPACFRALCSAMQKIYARSD